MTDLDNRRQPLNYRLGTKHINAEVKHFCERSALPNLGQLYNNTLQEQTEKSQLQMNKTQYIDTKHNTTNNTFPDSQFKANYS